MYCYDVTMAGVQGVLDVCGWPYSFMCASRKLCPAREITYGFNEGVSHPPRLVPSLYLSQVVGNVANYRAILRALGNARNFDSMFISRGMVEFDITELIRLRETPQCTRIGGDLGGSIL